MDELTTYYEEAYGKRPTLKLTPTKKRQATVERRIVRLLKRYKSFFIDTGEEIFFIDGGNWVHLQINNNEYNKIIGHANNVLPFIRGKRNIPWGSWNEEQIETKPKRKRKR